MLSTYMLYKSIYEHRNIPPRWDIFAFGGNMAKKDRKRTHGKNVFKYAEKASRLDYEYYGVHRKGDRVHIDSKRMKKVCGTEGPSELYSAALRIAEIPRHTAYFIPKKKKRTDYVTNEFRMKLDGLREQWCELRRAFENIKTPTQAADEYRLNAISYTADSDDYDDIAVDAMMAGIRREIPYRRLEISVCAQFIHQMATELDALMLRKCRQLGYAPDKESQISRNDMHTYLHGMVHGSHKVEALPGYRDAYKKFFTVWNLLKHNSEELFYKVKESYPDMLLTESYKNGDMSMYYLKIGNDYIEGMLTDLKVFYENVGEAFFGEDREESKWNYDEYFLGVIDEFNDESLF